MSGETKEGCRENQELLDRIEELSERIGRRTITSDPYEIMRLCHTYVPWLLEIAELADKIEASWGYTESEVIMEIQKVVNRGPEQIREQEVVSRPEDKSE